MARKSTSSSKKFTTVPPKAKPGVRKEASAIAVSAPEAVKTVSIEIPVTTPGIATLLAALHDVDAEVAREAATSLGQLGDATAVEPLIEILTNNNGYFHSVVRSAAATSLGQLKDRRAVEALLAAVHDPIADSSTEAVHALTALADPRAIGALVEVVRNENGFFANSVRRAAVLGLAKLGGDTALTELRNVAANEQEDSVIRQEASAAIESR
jgi:HEAT repeat protein